MNLGRHDAGRLDESQSKQLEQLSGDATQRLLYLCKTALTHYEAAIKQLNAAEDVANEVWIGL